VQDHLPEVCCKVNCGENGATLPANFSNAFADVFHAVFIGVGLIAEGSEILYEPDGTFLLHDGKDGAVVPAAGRLND